MVGKLGWAALLLTLEAHAVVIRGRVTGPLGAPAPGSRVQLIRLNGGARNAADAICGVGGEYEIRINVGGRFLLLTSPSLNAVGLKPQIGRTFYAGRTDLLTLDVALDYGAITPQTTSLTTHRETPLRQLSTETTQVAADELLTEATVAGEIAGTPGALVVQRGQALAPATLLLRGAPVTKVMVDGVSAEDLGGGFDLGGVGSTGLSGVASAAAIEVMATPNPLDGLDAGAGVLSFATRAGETLHPVLMLAGDVGGLSTVREEAVFTVAKGRGDALLAFSRLNTDNDLPAIPVHLISYVGNLGYHISGGSSLRGTVREDVGSAPLPLPFALSGVQPAGKRAAQNLVGGFTFETTTAKEWHNLVRYGLARRREEEFSFGAPTTGLPVTIVGANGYSAVGVASFAALPARADRVTNRDEFTYQTEYRVARFLSALGAVRYQDERGAELLVVGSERAERRHFSVAGVLQGEVRHRFFYEASGLVDRSSLLGVVGAPRVGLTYVPVRPGARRFRGTSLHVTAGTGFREPSLAEQTRTAGSTVTAGRARTLDVGVEQSVLGQKLGLRVGYFHNQFSHEAEVLAPGTLSSGLAYRTQGVEGEMRYQPFRRLLLYGGYSYLASAVELTAAVAVFNPRFPGVGIGGLTALAGARPFDRPPETGFFGVEATGRVVTASLKGRVVGRSDQSTGLVLNPTLLLPNRNLSPGYVALDGSVSYALTRYLTVYANFANLLDDRQMAPVGYLSTPFVGRAGVRVRLGRE